MRSKKNNANQSLLRWAGSKRKLVPQLIQFAPKDFNRYVEPFAGSACLCFSLCPKQALLSDINARLIETYQAIVKDHQKVYSFISEYEVSEIAYYEIRAKNELGNIFERAAKFIYLNRYSFNGVYRTNTKGVYNVPYGSGGGSMPPLEVFRRCSELLSTAELVAADFQKTMERVEKGDFVYLDPPYSTTTKWSGEYGPIRFTSQDVNRLLMQLKLIDKLGAKFIASYCDDPEFLQGLSDKWKVVPIQVARHVGGFSSRRSVANEILVRNYE